MAPARRAATTDEPRGSYSGYWTAEENAFIRNNYTIMSDKDMAQLLGKTVKSVRAHRNYMGLLRQDPKREWTIEEVMYLQDNWGYKTADTIARHLKRTPIAVITRAKIEGLGAQLSDGDLLSKERITTMMGLKNREIIDRWIDAGLPVRKKSIRGTKNVQHWTFVIKFGDLLKFLQEHPEEWDSRRVEPYALGIEYDWLKKKREEDKNKAPIGRRWTEAELSLLKSRTARKLPYSEIARDLNRSVKSVRAMSHRMGYNRKYKHNR